MTKAKDQPKKNNQAALEPSDYVHLHNHTHHSLLDGLTKVDELIDRVKDLNMTAVAITDHGTMSGVLELYKTAKAKGIKPILGMEAYVAARSRFDTDPSKDKARYHLTILAMNEVGYHNLMLLSSKANLEGFYYKPRIDRELLEKYGEGLIILSGCASGEVGEALRASDYDKAKEIASWYKKTFGDRYYLELQDHGHPDSPAPWDVQTGINAGVEKLAKELDIPCVVTSDGHYLDHSDREAHEILLCVGTAAYLSDERRMSLRDFELHVTDPAEIIERWSKTNSEAVKNTRRIADRCNVELKLGEILIPQFDVPEGETDKSYIEKLTYQGMANRYTDLSKEDYQKMTNQEIRSLLSKEQTDRLDMEFGVLTRMGFIGYFLIVQDFINWGKNKGIIFGPGRGSAAGSIIAFALNITDLDPLKYGLLFERFLNPDRISMPDIDIDIQDTRRGEVIEYCSQKYGAERVANIGTFGKMAARAAVRDVARVLEVPYAESDRLAKMVPSTFQGRHIPLAKSIKNDEDLKREYETNPTAKTVYDYAIRLEGTIRSHGVHAAGVVIAPDDVVKYVPVEMAQKGVVATQFPFTTVEDLGLLKMDFLGLSNLTTINNSLRIIKKVYKKEIDLPAIPLDDKKAYRLLQRGDTTGVFQLESAGMKRYLRDLKPTAFEDVVAMVALYRPGPMQFIDSFIKRKHGQERITYLHPGMENSLKNTYGVLVYQEQFMQISKEWCGFTGGQADTLRKAVGKKNIELMQKVKPEFVEGSIKVGGATKEIAEKFWDQLEEFANYCFNKSHAACYGLIAYWTAYLKAYYPDAFMAALMTSDQDDTDRLAIEIAECKRMGLAVLSPNVNESFVEFAVVPGKKSIRFGMAAVKGVGVAAVEEILRAREEGKFTSVEDFAKRVSTRKVNKKAWESLIKSGAFDEMGDRSDLLFNVETILAYGSKVQKEALSGQEDLFAMLGEDRAISAPGVDLQKAPQRYSEKDQLTWERELLGLYISAHPLDNYEKYFEEQTISLDRLTPEVDGKKATFGGLISTVRTIVTKNNKKMAFVKLEDKFAEGEVIVFPNLFEEVGAKLVQDAVIRVSGKVSAKDRDGNLGSEAKIIADEVVVVSDEELDNYQTTGQKMSAPKARKPRVNTINKSTNISTKTSPPEVDLSKEEYKPPKIVEEDLQSQKLFVLLRDIADQDKLVSLKKACSEFTGFTEVILVLGEDKKDAMRLPFKVNPSKELVEKLTSIMGKDCAILK